MTADLITLKEPRSAAAEAFRTLRTNLTLGRQKALTTLLITSTMQPEDKSTTAANLAVTFAQSGHRTILVDADLRRPHQHQLWNVGGERGLMTLFGDDAALAKPPLAETDVPNLSLLPAGPVPDVPADRLGSPRKHAPIIFCSTHRRYWPPLMPSCWAARLTVCC